MKESCIVQKCREMAEDGHAILLTESLDPPDWKVTKQEMHHPRTCVRCEELAMRVRQSI